jgi:hypothetical protein
MRIPKRFALSTLMLAMLAVAMVFGYAQWRRLKLVSQVRSLNESGIYFVEFGSARGMGRWYGTLRVTDDFWARVEPQAVGVMISIDRFGRCSLTGRSEWTTLDEAEINLKEVCHALKGIGITDVDFNIWGDIGYGYHAGPSTDLGFLRATHSEWSSHFRDPNDLYFWEKGPD